VIDIHETAGGTDGREVPIKVVGSISLLNNITVSWIQIHIRSLPEIKKTLTCAQQFFTKIIGLNVKCDISATTGTKQNWFG